MMTPNSPRVSDEELDALLSTFESGEVPIRKASEERLCLWACPELAPEDRTRSYQQEELRALGQQRRLQVRSEPPLSECTRAYDTEELRALADKRMRRFLSEPPPGNDQRVEDTLSNESNEPTQSRIRIGEFSPQSVEIKWLKESAGLGGENRKLSTSSARPSVLAAVLVLVSVWVILGSIAVVLHPSLPDEFRANVTRRWFAAPVSSPTHRGASGATQRYLDIELDVPHASVYVDGRMVGNSGRGRAFVQRGSHVVSARAPGYRDLRFELQLERDLSLVLDMQPNDPKTVRP